MPLHDWTRVRAGIYHSFHNAWPTHLMDALNGGGLPRGYYALTDQRTGVYEPDVVAYSARAAAKPVVGGVAAAVADPRADTRAVSKPPRTPARRRLVIRSADRVVAVVELVSRANKDREAWVADFAEKVADMLRARVAVAVVDILPPGPHDPGGFHPAVWAALEDDNPAAGPPPDRPLTFAGYDALPQPVAYLNYAAVGQVIPEVPLFLDGGSFIYLPLEASYMVGIDRLPEPLRAELTPGPGPTAPGASSAGGTATP